MLSTATAKTAVTTTQSSSVSFGSGSAGVFIYKQVGFVGFGSGSAGVLIYRTELLCDSVSDGAAHNGGAHSLKNGNTTQRATH
jgi:hypothetical protein